MNGDAGTDASPRTGGGPSGGGTGNTGTTTADTGAPEDAGGAQDASNDGSVTDAALDAAPLNPCTNGSHFACLDFDDGGIPAAWISQYAADASESSWMVTDAASFSPPNSAALRNDERIIFGAWDAGARTVTISAKIRLPEGGMPYVLRLLTTNANVPIGGAALSAGGDSTSGWTTSEGTPEARAHIAAPANVFVEASVQLTVLSDGGLSASMNVGGTSVPARAVILNQAFDGVAAGIGNSGVNGTVLYDNIVVDVTK